MSNQDQLQSEKLAQVNLEKAKTWKPGMVGDIDTITWWLNLYPAAGPGEALIVPSGDHYQAVQYF